MQVVLPRSPVCAISFNYEGGTHCGRGLDALRGTAGASLTKRTAATAPRLLCKKMKHVYKGEVEMLFPIYFLLFLILGIPTLFFLMYLNVAALSLGKLGLSPEGAFFLFTLSLMGSVVNIPVYTRKVWVERPEFPWFPMFFYYPPAIQDQVVAVNLGGCVIPTLFSLSIMHRANFGAVLASTAVVAATCYAVARPVQGRGILMPAFIPPLVAALSAIVFSRRNPAVVAYIAGTIGTLIGADLMHLKETMRMGPGVLSIGGAGVYDGIFLAGLMAAFLAR